MQVPLVAGSASHRLQRQIGEMPPPDQGEEGEPTASEAEDEGTRLQDRTWKVVDTWVDLFGWLSKSAVGGVCKVCARHVPEAARKNSQKAYRSWIEGTRRVGRAKPQRRTFEIHEKSPVHKAAATKGAGGDVKTWFGKQVSAQASVSEDGCMEVDVEDQDVEDQTAAWRFRACWGAWASRVVFSASRNGH